MIFIVVGDLKVENLQIRIIEWNLAQMRLIICKILKQ